MAKRKNIEAGYYDQHGFHPIRWSKDYDPDRAGDDYSVGTDNRGLKKKPKKKNSAHSAPLAFFKRRKARKKNAAMGYKGSAGWRASQTKPKSNPRKQVSVKNFTGTITRNSNGTVTVKGRGKVAGKKRANPNAKTYDMYYRTGTGRDAYWALAARGFEGTSAANALRKWKWGAGMKYAGYKVKAKAS